MWARLGRASTGTAVAGTFAGSASANASVAGAAAPVAGLPPTASVSASSSSGGASVAGPAGATAATWCLLALLLLPNALPPLDKRTGRPGVTPGGPSHDASLSSDEAVWTTDGGRTYWPNRTSSFCCAALATAGRHAVCLDAAPVSATERSRARYASSGMASAA